MRIAILWHMHQPDYRNPETGHEEMPWVRLHALKNYLDMLRLAAEAPPEVKVTFNLTPVLMDQLHQMATQGPRDPHYRLSRRPPSQLSPQDRAFLLTNFFSVNLERVLQPLPGFAALHRKMGGPEHLSAALATFTNQDYLDLQVYFNLAWSGRTLREDGLVKHLIERGCPFTEKERDALLDLQDRFLGCILPTYRKLWEEGRIEISTTPLNHPILPLLCDLRAAREGDPHCPIEGLDFRFPDDAKEQVVRGLALAREHLGRTPHGMWPSEGSVSDAVIRMLEPLGVTWVATDRQILERSLALSGLQVPFPPHLRPWRLRGSEGPAMFFRDTPLSDRIGFTWSRWSPDEAVADFLARVRSLAAAYTEADKGCLPVILDGENAWEYYEDNGRPFLSALYRAIADAPDLEAVTFSEALTTVPTQVLPRLRAGSWIYANLNTWIGHPEKNRAWALLSETRREFEDQTRRPGVPAEAIEAARRILLRAEASDWFWWMGDDHPSENKPAFDEHFRRTLYAVWRLLGRPPPASLLQPIPSAVPLPRARVTTPTAFIEPMLDGEDLQFFGWVGAGGMEIGRSGAIFTGDTGFRRLDYGFGPTRLFLRLVPGEGRAEHLLRGGTVRLYLRDETHGERVLHLEPGGTVVLDDARTPARWALGRHLEVGVDLAPLGYAPGSPLGFHLEVVLSEGAAERVPMDGEIKTTVPPPHLDLLHWSI